MEVDYQLYADGEALLGWLNCTVQTSRPSDLDSGKLLQRLAVEIQDRLRSHQAEVAHLKITLKPEGVGSGEIAVVSLVRNDFVPEQSLKLNRPADRGQLIINLRAEAAPEFLERAVRDALAATAASFPGLAATLDHLEQFRPGKPSPTHRFTTAT